MLQTLLIQNYALIDHLQIDFEDGFSVITGETGSGKSILLGALGLILGDRIDHSSIRDRNKKCIIEGNFIVSEKDHKEYFGKLDLDFESETIIRREVSTSGKSRAFINDTPVSLSMLREICSLLIDIHSQHETLMINNPQFIIDLIDSQLTSPDELNLYNELFIEFSQKKKELQTLLQKETDAQNQKDFLSFLIQEFEEYNLDELAENNIEEEYKLLANAEDIKRRLGAASDLLNNNDRQSDIISNLKQAHDELNNLSSFGSQFNELSARIESSLIELQDIANECSHLADTTELDENELSILELKTSFVNRLLHKHQLSDIHELLQKRDEIKKELTTIDNLSDEIESLQDSVNQLKKKLIAIATTLSEHRKKIALQLQAEAKTLLGAMNMKNAEIDFRFESLSELSKNGKDSILLYVKTNLGSTFEPLKKVASGGETSRIMLAIKSLQSTSRSLPTIIFDEIDTGVSGEVANRMGSIMTDLGKKMQVISITHLPQIAAKGKCHYKVFKKEEQNRTITNIRKLDNKERLNELAELLSGSDISEAAIKNAKELLNTK